MEDLVDFISRSFVKKHEDLFGNGTFVEFKPDDDKQFNWTGGYNSRAVFGRIVYEKNKKKCLSDPLVLKISPEVAFFPDALPYNFANEITFFARIIPAFRNAREINDLFPKFYDSLLRFSPGGDEAAIIFENLQASGYVASKEKSFLDFNHLKLMLRKLGEFHAYSYQIRNKDPNRFYGLTKLCLETNFAVLRLIPFEYPDVMNRGIKPLLDDPVYSHKLTYIQEVAKMPTDTVAEILTCDVDSPTSVICHGDFLRSNVMFKYESGKPVDVKMVDMASWRVASPVVDLAQVLYLNVDQQMRNEHWDDLITEYYRALKETFPQNEVPSKESILLEFQKKSILGYIVAAYFLPNLIAMDNNLPPQEHYFPDEYKNFTDLAEVPLTDLMHAMEQVGGQLATDGLTNILKDLLDRGFV